MERSERDAIAALCAMAALADGRKSEEERERIRGILDGLGGGELLLASQRVLLGQTSLEAEAAKLTSAEGRSLAYEMAVAVCNADGAANPEERAFLDRLRGTLGLDPAPAEALRDQAETLASSPLGAGPAPAAPDAAASGAATTPAAAAPLVPAPSAPAPAPAPGATVVDEAQLDRSILNYAILTGGLELLPQSLASMAIIPLQMKMVYEIGRRYGYTLDRGHVTEFLGTVGIGLTGQVLETVARKLLGSVGRMAGGGLLGGLLGTAGGMAFSFGTTWALGQVARAYYSAGRRLDGGALRDLFRTKLEEARSLYPRYRSEVETRARGIDVGQLANLVRGN
jgi:uncharacterized protein (DUF697 family)/tellurite resistance protein